MAVTTKQGFLRQAWDLAWPYWKSDEKWSAIGLLAAVIALNLITVWLNVRFNYWNNDFYNALQQYDWPEFWRQFAIFGALALAFIVVGVYSSYLRGILHIRWRRWLTERFLRNWLEDQAYYRMQLNQATTDNPDQRISDDLNRFASISLTLSLGLLSSFVTLVSFLSILWTLSGALTIPLGGGASIDIPGYMVFAALIYAVAGTMLTRWIGYPLIRLNFDQQRYEADFRFSMVRLRENAENVAFYGGEAREFDTFQTRFVRVVANWWGIIKRRKKLTWFTYGYDQVAIVFPFLVAAPRYFDKVIQLGGLMQIASAFRQVQESLSFIISSYTEIAEYQSVVQRLAGFREKMNEIAAEQQRPQAIEIVRDGTGVAVDALDLNLPDGRSLRPDITLAATPGKSLLITGASGAGKSTLLRAIAGLWPFGRGRIRVGDGRYLFLPQRPYLPLGTLADALVYPRSAAELPRDNLAEALRTVGLPELVDRLEEEANWAQRLSIGEQQRLAFARVLLARPEIVFLDEATSALDEAAEVSLYRLLREAPWKPTIVSVGHHGTLRRFHDAVVDLARSPVSRAAVG
ncbi:MAG TPA: ABC transporter ATP-binding protein/permease [Stellaceae bacterium]|jgi:putative ATP-binding cassette transporter|nr:ABC transporter ATP-binding protein/permease [Stellaceae bacterium]